MPKYTDEQKNKCVELVKQGKALTEIQREVGPNPKAIERYCKKAGVALPKREKKVKAAAEKKDVTAKAPAAPQKK